MVKITRQNLVPILALVAAFMLILPAGQYAFAKFAGDDGPFITSVGTKIWSSNYPNYFIATYKVHAGEQSVENVKILVFSDRQVTETTVDFVSANNYDLITVKIMAFSPYSINAKIIDYQVGE